MVRTRYGLRRPSSSGRGGDFGSGHLHAGAVSMGH
jgi:hypothetical protein